MLKAAPDDAEGPPPAGDEVKVAKEAPKKLAKMSLRGAPTVSDPTKSGFTVSALADGVDGGVAVSGLDWDAKFVVLPSTQAEPKAAAILDPSTINPAPPATGLLSGTTGETEDNGQDVVASLVVKGLKPETEYVVYATMLDDASKKVYLNPSS